MSNKREGRERGFKDLKLQSTSFDPYQPFYAFKSPEPVKPYEYENKQYEQSPFPNPRFQGYSYIDNTLNPKLNSQPWVWNEAMRSPDCKFVFNSGMFGSVAGTPTSLHHQNMPMNDLDISQGMKMDIKFPTNVFNFDRKYFPMQPSPSPMRMPPMWASPGVNFKNERQNNCFVFPPPSPIPPREVEPIQKKELELKPIPTRMEAVQKPQSAKKDKNNKEKKVPKTAKRKNLSVREDVMNKNIFRAFKRELKNLYMNFNEETGQLEDKKEAKSRFRISAQEFSSYLLDSSACEQQSDFNRSVFSTYVAIFLDYCQMKKELRSEEDKERLKVTFEVIYSYSHQRFYEFIEIPEIKVLFKLIMAKTGIEKFISDNESLNKEKYRVHINQLLSKM